VIVFSVAGVAAIFGKIPGAESKTGDPFVQNMSTAPSASQAMAEERASLAARVQGQPQPLAQAPAPLVQAPAPLAQAPAPLAQAPAPLAQAPAPVLCADCGVIESIRVAEVKGQGSGLGAVAGGVAGGLIGNQIGHGTGRTVATIAGAAGGAYAGNAIEKNVKKHTVYRVTLRMEDGSLRTLSQREAPAYAVGDRVRVSKGRITERA
jgi:outer membrane lipoprotein SlyB